MASISDMKEKVETGRFRVKRWESNSVASLSYIFQLSRIPHVDVLVNLKALLLL